MGPYFNSRDKHYKDPFGAVPCGAEVRFALADDTYYGCELLVLREFAGTEDTCALPPAEGGFAGTYTAPAGGELCWYCFRLTDVDGRCVWYGKNGVQDAPEKAARWQLTVYEPSPAPDWFGRGVTYQIFPDRFRRVSMPDVSHMPGHRWLHRGWNEQPVFLPDEHGQITNRDFFGGSLQGITEKLDYLAGLGVTTLYLNPIFEAASNHRYDTGDYRAIDPLLGTEADFRALCTAAHQRGMRVILDGVFNHTGSNSRYFNAEGYYPEPGAAQSQNSEYYNWYSFHPWPSDYDAWWGVKTLPAVNEAQPAYRDFIFGDQDSVVRHWLRCGADGWRLDVVHMLGEAGGARNNMQHVAGITEAAKETQPEAYIVGEHFGDARQWLQADVEDAAMNYRGFTFPLWGFLANTDISYDPQQIDAQTCMAWMDNYRAGLSHQQQLRMFNQLDSHDTARFKTLLGRDIARLPLAVVWLFTWPGVPCIYYGDEVGLDGKNDPFCRKPFPWQVEKQDTALFALYQRMIALRKKSQALRHGGCQVLYAEDNVVVFVRVLNQQRVLVAINRGEACEVVLPASPFLNAVQWQCKEGHGQLTDGILALPAISATVWMN